MFRQRKERLVFLKAHETCVRENKKRHERDKRYVFVKTKET